MKVNSVLDLTSEDSRENREITLDLVRDGPSHFLKYTNQRTLADFSNPTEPFEADRLLFAKPSSLSLPKRHEILPVDIGKVGMNALQMAYEIQPERYEDLVALEGIGPKRIRALALISELIYGASTSWTDPAKYSFAHGGKDGYPYPVDRDTFDHSITALKGALK